MTSLQSIDLFSFWIPYLKLGGKKQFTHEKKKHFTITTTNQGNPHIIMPVRDTVIPKNQNSGGVGRKNENEKLKTNNQ